MNFLLNNSDILFFCLFVLLGYFAGSMAEKRHYTSITKREKELVGLPVVTFPTTLPCSEVDDSFLVTGNVVISIDYFKRFLATLKNIVGGHVTSYESLVDRARREAILRMKAEAAEKHADMIINFRLETSTIGRSANKRGQVGSIEALAYGTAISRQSS